MGDLPLQSGIHRQLHSSSQLASSPRKPNCNEGLLLLLYPTRILQLRRRAAYARVLRDTSSPQPTWVDLGTVVPPTLHLFDNWRPRLPARTLDHSWPCPSSLRILFHAFRVEGKTCLSVCLDSRHAPAVVVAVSVSVSISPSGWMIRCMSASTSPLVIFSTSAFSFFSEKNTAYEHVGWSQWSCKQPSKKMDPHGETTCSAYLRGQHGCTSLKDGQNKPCHKNRAGSDLPQVTGTAKFSCPKSLKINSRIPDFEAVQLSISGFYLRLFPASHKAAIYHSDS